MKLFSACIALWAVACTRVEAVAPTDSYSDADPAQSGYLPNHNMDPAIVDSIQFGQLWKVRFLAGEQFYAKSLTFTPKATGKQLLFLASSMNYIRTLDAKTGTLINERQVHTPFLQSDIGCTDIPGHIGIIGTPVIDPITEIAYFFSKTYIPNYRSAGNTGTYNGVYYFHAVDINTLTEVDGYPVLVDGAVADNDPRKYFIGGIVLQRPSLTMIGSVVYGAFGGHCDLFNYTGLVLGVDVNLKRVVTQFAVESGPLVPQSNQWDLNGSGGQGGIWMSGMALASDGNRLFWVSGNGNAHENNGVPASGSSNCRTLGEACVSLQVREGGVLSLTDYFQPYDYQNMDGGDQDFGSGGIALLDPTVFKGTGVDKMAVTSGKNGKIYVLNANNLGGYKLGPGGTDGVVQTIVTNKAVFGGSGSYPLEGGYIYSTPVGYPTYAYKLGFTSSGVPVFSQAGQTKETSAGRVGVGIPTVTSYQGKAGTGILWMTDPDAGLRAWYAVPGADGFLKTIKLPQVNGLNKFQRPAFGDSRLYVTDANGVLYCLGSPVNLPITCNSPVDFGNVPLGSKSTQDVNCTANINIASINSATVGDNHFIIDSAKLPRGAIAKGTSFTFPVTWDLTNTQVKSTPNASFGNISPGVKSTALDLATTNAVAGYSTLFPISLTGTEVSQKPFLVTAPTTVDFGGVVLLKNQNASAITLPFSIRNAGLSNMSIVGYAYTKDDLDGTAKFTNSTVTNGIWDLGEGFTSSNLPPINAVVAPNSAVLVYVTFDPVNGVADYSSFFQIWTTGGTTNTIFEGTESTAPIANFSISTNEGGWLPDSNLIMDFGDVRPGATHSRQIRICNNGGSVLDISKSKPPNGVFHISDPAELHEELEIAVGTCAYGTVLFSTNTEDFNADDISYKNSWTLNTNDLTFGVHEVKITGTLVSHKVGPVGSAGQQVYTYLGCFLDNQNGRLLPNQPYVGDNNTNGNCQQLCNSQGYIFEGTEYRQECYCGNRPPSALYQDIDNVRCTFACTGDQDDRCGGDGGYVSIFYDATRYTPGSNSTSTSGGLQIINTTGNYDYLGCYSEGSAGRALSGKAPAAPANGLTIEACRDSCQGYQFFGVEFANECYCGNSINTGSMLQASTDPDTNGCSMSCANNATEYCGGPNRLNMYRLNGNVSVPTPTPAPGNPVTPAGTPFVQQIAGNGTYVYAGCYTDNVNGRALSGLANPIAGNMNKPDACARACFGYKYFGMEYGAECYCGDAIGAGSTVADGGSDPNANGCSMTCAANSSLYCGGPNRLTMYNIAPNVTLPAPVGPPVPANVVTVGDFDIWLYQGCYSEGTDTRALTGSTNPIPGDLVTVQACGAACSAFVYFGVEYSGECYCGNILNGKPALVVGTTPGQTGCSMTCTGNGTTYCGGSNRLNLYMQRDALSSVSASTTLLWANATATGTMTSASSRTGPQPTHTGPITVQSVAGGWRFAGCYVDNVNTRALTDLTNPISSSSLTNELCASACIGYNYFGTEYSGECYCGNALMGGSTIASGGDDPIQNGCSMTCNGNNNEYCGGPNRLNLYTTNATAVSATGIMATTLPTTTSSLKMTSTTIASASIATFSFSNTTLQMASVTVFTSPSLSVSASSTRTASTTGVNSTTSLLMASIIDISSSPSVSMSAIRNLASTISANSRALPSATLSVSAVSTSSSLILASKTGMNLTALLPTISSTTYTSTSVSASALSNRTLAFITSSSPSRALLLATSVTATTTPASFASSRATAASSSSTSVINMGPWQYLGCANETFPHALPHASMTSPNSMTIEICQTFCSGPQNNYALAGLENGDQCFCGNSLQSYSSLGFTGCNVPCRGNRSEVCGGSLRLSIWNLTTYVPPTTVKAVGSYSFSACYNESKTGRLLDGKNFSNATGMAVESCVDFCNSYGLPYAGVENGQQCYCASSLPSNATVTSTGNCNMVCTGNNREFCGAKGLLGVYHNDPSSVDSSGNIAVMNKANLATVSANTAAPTASGKPAVRKVRKTR